VDEVAALVAFVAGLESSFINGANLTIDGGIRSGPTLHRPPIFFVAG
jgi:NAD(P)-dependent dehydrogenase (short-subunit alcohol dehydrogenase family)